jgi:hypothetical protein
MSSVGRLVIGSDDDEYDNRADFAAEDTHYGEDLERRQMLDASSEAEHGDKRAGRDELKRFLHAQKTHGRRNTLACCGALALLLVTLLVSDTPHNYLARDEVRQAVRLSHSIPHAQLIRPCGAGCCRGHSRAGHQQFELQRPMRVLARASDLSHRIVCLRVRISHPLLTRSAYELTAWSGRRVRRVLRRAAGCALSSWYGLA